MKNVLLNETPEIRDTSMRIFDSYVALAFVENSARLKDTTFLAFSAVASMIISSKLHKSTGHLQPVRFFLLLLFIQS